MHSWTKVVLKVTVVVKIKVLKKVIDSRFLAI